MQPQKLNECFISSHLQQRPTEDQFADLQIERNCTFKIIQDFMTVFIKLLYILKTCRAALSVRCEMSVANDTGIGVFYSFIFTHLLIELFLSSLAEFPKTVCNSSLVHSVWIVPGPLL